jgi:S-DNA-T family DNA segregation ATPase FtsK/SpoIIIE
MRQNREVRLNLRLQTPATGRTQHVVVRAAPETPMADVTAALGKLNLGELFLGGERLPSAGDLADSGLRDGVVLGVGAPVTAAGASASGYELAVVGGPGAGQRFPLPASGTVVVGSGAPGDNRISLAGTDMAGDHLRLSHSSGTWTVEDLGSPGGTTVDGVAIAAATPLRTGEVIGAGRVLLEVRQPLPADADLHPDGEGGLGFNRPPRIRWSAGDVAVTLPAAPEQTETPAFPWVQAGAPVGMAVLGALMFKRPEAMLLALLSPVITIGNYMNGKKKTAARAEKEGVKFATGRDAALRSIAEAAVAEVTDERGHWLDPAGVAAVATGPNRRLWERRVGDADATTVRVGTAHRRARLTLVARGGETPPPPPLLPHLPVTVNLASVGVLGVAGPSEVSRAVTRSLVTQLASLRSPRDLRVVVLTDSQAETDWDFVRWLPHATEGDAGGPVAFIGNDDATREERLKELTRLLDHRVEVRREASDAVFDSHVLVVFDGVRDLRSLTGATRILKEGPAVGILSVGIDRDRNRLPEEGRAELVVDAGGVGTLSVEGLAPVTGILLDQVDTAVVDEVARGLAPLRDTGDDETAAIPTAVRFIDLAAVDLEQPDDIVGRWSARGRTTAAVVGVSADGPFSVDLKKDGPHGLVAGTTGSGKSEFLQTLVAGLALGNRPDAINFVLVDYKGASAFADCERLPHTVGMVTNLDGHLTERALISLEAELHRRETVLKDLGAPDVDTAWEKDAAGAAARGLARLVIVIDEFAELVHELPDFVTGLIRIARVGRSLGVHLILATQRPAGVVTAEMRANTGLRVALRMEDKNDSAEVLESPHAAAISRSTPGRGFVRTGGTGGVIQFQSARVAGRRPGATAAAAAPPLVDTVSWAQLGYAPPAPPAAARSGADSTDLQALVDVINAATEQLAIPKSPSPWLPPLPDQYVLPGLAAALSQVSLADGARPRPAVFGVEDVPSAQAQVPAAYDLASAGHLLVIGAARSGRSTVLRTLASALAASVPPSDMHLYGLDFGNGALLPLKDLPHCGAVVSRTETDRLERLVGRLGEEVARRQEILSRSGFADIAEQRAASPAETRLPYLVVLLDRFEGFTSQFPPESGSELPAALTRLVREGLGAGLRLIISGDRSLLGDRTAALVEDKLILRLADKQDYRLANIDPKNVPEEMPEGRAFRAGTGTDIQVGVLGADASGPAQAAAVAEIATAATLQWPPASQPSRPFRVDALPTSVPWKEAWDLARAAGTTPRYALVGVGGDELGAVGVDLGSDVPGFVVAGLPKTGRSTALLSIARSLTAGGTTIVVVCPRRSPLEALAGETNVARVLSGRSEPADLGAAVTTAAANGPLVIIIDDAEAFARSEADEALRDWLRETTPGQAAVVVGGNLEDVRNEMRGVVAEAKKPKAALLLSPGSSMDGDLVGIRLPKNLTGRMPPGRGIFAMQGDMTVVQVPLAGGAG